MTVEARDIGNRVAHSDALDAAIRLGLVAYGVVHLLIGWLAFQLAIGDNEGEASNTGAMHQLAEQPFGHLMIWAVAVGMAFLVIWRILEAAVGHRGEDDAARRWARAGSLGKALIYGAVGYSALKVAIGSGSGGKSTTAKLMDAPAGSLLVGLVGLGIFVYGARHAYRGLSDDYAENLTSEGRSGQAGTAYLALGKIGYVAKGLVICVVGVLFGYAAISHDPEKSGGLDGALRTLLDQPFGPYLLGAAALGFGCYGLFCLARARHLSK